MEQRVKLVDANLSSLAVLRSHVGARNRQQRRAKTCLDSLHFTSVEEVELRRQYGSEEVHLSYCKVEMQVNLQGPPSRAKTGGCPTDSTMTVLTIWPLFTTAFAFHCWTPNTQPTHPTSCASHPSPQRSRYSSAPSLRSTSLSTSRSPTQSSAPARQRRVRMILV
jgi:hypothetical protein